MSKTEFLSRLQEYKANKIKTITITFIETLPEGVEEGESFNVTCYTKNKLYLEGMTSNATFLITENDKVELIPFQLLNSTTGRLVYSK